MFFDRGIPELICYCHLIKTAVPDYLRNAAESFRYNQKVFIMQPWKEIYKHDEERKQTWEEAVDTYHAIANSYLECGYQLVEVPKVSVTERVDLILKLVSR